MEKEENSAELNNSEIIEEIGQFTTLNHKNKNTKTSKIKRSSTHSKKKKKEKLIKLRLPVILEWDHESSSNHDHLECLENFDPSKFLSPHINVVLLVNGNEKSILTSSSSKKYQKEYEESKVFIRERIEEIIILRKIDMMKEPSAVDRQAIEKEYKRKIDFLNSLLTKLETHHYTRKQVVVAIFDYQMPEDAVSYHRSSNHNRKRKQKEAKRLNDVCGIISQGGVSNQQLASKENSNPVKIVKRKY